MPSNCALFTSRGWLQQRCRLSLANQQPNLQTVAVDHHQFMGWGNARWRFSTALLVPMAYSGIRAMDGFLSPASSGRVHAHSDKYRNDINRQIETQAALARTTPAPLRVRAAYTLAR